MPDPMTGPDQAEAMLRRVSPEGRLRAQREQVRRRSRSMRLAGRMLVAALLVIAALVVAHALFGTLGGATLTAAVLVFAVACVAIVLAGRERPAVPGRLTAAPVAALPGETVRWLEAERPALPAPARTLADDLAAKIAALEPQLARLDPNEPGADAVRRLLAVELPGLVDRHRSVPPTLRADSGADAHLLRGLGIVDAEVSRMAEELARGDLDALATQDRFLELKYQGDAMLPGPSA